MDRCGIFCKNRGKNEYALRVKQNVRKCITVQIIDISGVPFAIRYLTKCSSGTMIEIETGAGICRAYEKRRKIRNHLKKKGDDHEGSPH